MMNDELATTSQDCQGDLTLGTLGCVELFVTLGFATKSQRICEACEGLPAWFNASQCARAKGAGNTLILQIRSTRRDEKPCYESFFPSMPTER